MNLIDKYLGESDSDWKRGMWVAQRRSNENEYGILIDKTSKGWMAVTIDDDRKIAAKKSIAHSYPPFVSLDKNEVPIKLMDKVFKKLHQLGIKIENIWANLYLV